MKCINCGADLLDGQIFCTNCGTRQASEPQPFVSPANVDLGGPQPAAPQTNYNPADAGYQGGYVPPQGGYVPPQGGYPGGDQQWAAPAAPAPASSGNVVAAWTAALDVLKSRPLMLLGLSLLYALLTVLAELFGILPIIYLPITWVLEVGVCAIYMDGLRGKEVNSEQLFQGFRGGKFVENAFGMFWRGLWMIIWGIVVGICASIGMLGVAGAATGSMLSSGFRRFGFILLAIVGVVLTIGAIVYFIRKSYSYSFVPYILLDDKGITGTKALKKSMAMTRGMILSMFLADLLPYVIFFIACAILGALSRIPFIGWIFTIVLVVATILFYVFKTLFFGLVRTHFYFKAADKN